MVIEAGGERSNPLPLTQRADLTGAVSLPPGSLLQPGLLRVSTAYNNTAPVGVDGRFKIITGFEMPMLVEVQDTQGEVILAALALDPDIGLMITAETTANWVIYFLAHPALTPPGYTGFDFGVQQFT